MLGTQERGLLVGDGHSRLALTVNGLDKQREGTADTRKREEELKGGQGSGMQAGRYEGCNQSLVAEISKANPGPERLNSAASECPGQWSSTFPMLHPFTRVPHVVMTPNLKIIFVATS